ncbi:MAG: NAD(P)-dependent oxidoreductase [Bacteriovoracaceae bacterium]
MIICFDDVFHQHVNNIDTIYLSSKEECRLDYFEKAQGIIVRLGIVLDQKFLQQFKNLKFVATVTTGLDHIDVSYCQSKQVKVFSLKGEIEFLETIRSTPEHTWGLILALMRKTPAAVNSVSHGEWNRKLFVGNELIGKTIGILGFGRVGKILAKYAHAFDMKVLATEIDPGKCQHEFVNFVELERLLSESDIFIVAMSLEEGTKNFIRKEHFQRMKKKPWFINTARGAIIDEGALLNALETGIIKGAALDVLADENSFCEATKFSSHPLVDYMKNHENLLITPHIAGTSSEAMIRTAQFIGDKIRSLHV